MTFAHPWGLLALLLPLLLGLVEYWRRRPGLVLPLDHSEVGAGRWLHHVLLLFSLLPQLLLAIAIVLLCRPLAMQQPRQERKLTNVEFLLDVSGSMTSSFGQGSRFDAAMASIQQFTNHRRGDAFGLTIFGNQVLRWTPLTKDLSAIANATPFLRPEQLPPQFGGTEIGRALRHCRQTLVERGDGDRVVVLLSDGASADLHNGVARRIGLELAVDQIVLYAIHIGDSAIPSDLLELTRPGGGRAFSARSKESLASVFEHIDRMRPVELKPVAARAADHFGPWAIAGIAVLGLYQVALCGVRATPW